MRIRAGFVSNSSSSSYCLFGTENSKILEEIENIVGFDDDVKYDGYELNQNYTLQFATSDGDVLAAGFGTDFLLDRSINEAKSEIVEILKGSMGIVAKPNQFDLVYGTTYN